MSSSNSFPLSRFSFPCACRCLLVIPHSPLNCFPEPAARPLAVRVMLLHSSRSTDRPCGRVCRRLRAGGPERWRASRARRARRPGCRRASRHRSRPACPGLRRPTPRSPARHGSPLRSARSLRTNFTISFVVARSIGSSFAAGESHRLFRRRPKLGRLADGSAITCSAYLNVNPPTRPDRRLSATVTVCRWRTFTPPGYIGDAGEGLDRRDAHDAATATGAILIGTGLPLPVPLAEHRLPGADALRGRSVRRVGPSAGRRRPRPSRR
jgi:hypothetical protein